MLGSGVAYILNYSIVRAAGAAVGSTVAYLVPVSSTALGALVLGEPLRWNQPVGAVGADHRDRRFPGPAFRARRTPPSRAPPSPATRDPPEPREPPDRSAACR